MVSSLSSTVLGDNDVLGLSMGVLLGHKLGLADIGGRMVGWPLVVMMDGTALVIVAFNALSDTVVVVEFWFPVTFVTTLGIVKFLLDSADTIIDGSDNNDDELLLVGVVDVDRLKFMDAALFMDPE